MYSWRVTKYDPVNRDTDGRYLDDQEWICYSEVGKKVSLEEYQETEQMYVNAIRSFMDEMGLEQAYVIALEQWKDEVQKQNASEMLSRIWIGKRIPLEEIQQLASLTLRNAIWCKIAFKRQFFVHFGYDFYMYIGAGRECTKAIDEVTKSGLFVEECASPYQSS